MLEGLGCRPAGTPPESCAEGFTAVDHACRPVLPEKVCPDGQLATPGEACHPVAPCGGAPFGEAPLGEGTLYVDISYAGPSPDGSMQAPFPSIQTAVDQAQPGAVIAVAKGVYEENVTIKKSLSLWGACPGDVKIHGTSASAALRIQKDAVSVHTIAVTSNDIGVRTVSANGVTLDRVWVHDTGANGISIDGVLDKVTIKGTLVEKAKGTGLSFSGATLTLKDSSVRETVLATDTNPGIGLFAEASGKVCTVEILHSTLERNRVASVYNRSCNVSLEGTVVRDTFRGNSSAGMGVFAYTEEGGIGRARLSVVRSAIQNSDAYGVFTGDADVIVDSTLISKVKVAPGETSGIGLNMSDFEGRSTKADIRSSVVENVQGVGIAVDDSTATITSTRIRGGSIASDGIGDGIAVFGGKLRPSAVVTGVVVEHAIGVGIVAKGADLTISDTLVSSTQASPKKPHAGAGIMVTDTPGTCDPSVLSIQWSRINDSQQVGLHIMGSQADIVSTVVTGTTPSKFEDLGGWGIYAGAGICPQPSKVTVRTSSITDNQSGGVFADDSQFTVERTEILRTQNIPGSDFGFIGIGVHAFADKFEPQVVSVLESRVESSTFAGISTLGAKLVVDSTVVRDIQPSLGFSYGILVSGGGTGTVTNSDVSESAYAGVACLGATLKIKDTNIHDNKPNPSDVHKFGDGILVSVLEGEGSAEVENVTVSGSARAGVATFGAPVSLKGNAFVCNTIDINTESKEGKKISFTSLGGNACGCPYATSECDEQSLGIEPPPPLPPGPPSPPVGG